MSALMLRRTFLSSIFALLLVSQTVLAQTTAFTYQGKLNDNGNPANGNYDLQFTLFDALSGGTQQGVTQTVSNVTVSDGIFTVVLDFGPCATCFDGSARFLEIAVKKTTDSTFTMLAPRQPINSTPYAQVADGLSVACVNCVTSGQIASVNGSAVSGPIPVASVPAGSTNYIQNTATQQTSANFNIDGNGLIGGNVGIGTTTPQSTLEVQTATDTYGITHTDGTTRLNTFINSSLGGAGGIGTQSNHPLFFYAGNLPRMLINPTGSVGIGTISPQARLHVNGTSWFQGDTTPLPATAGQGIAIGYLNSFAAGYILPYDYAANTAKNLLLSPLGGNVGIGTFTPADRLTVQTATSSYGITHTDGAITVGSFIGSGGGWLGTKSNHPLYFFANAGNALMTVAASGNVGVGTITPADRLTVQTASNNYGLTHTNGTVTVGTYVDVTGGWYGTKSSHPLYFFTNNSNPLMTVTTSGNVGIGTLIPGHKLTVLTATNNTGISHTDGTVDVGTFIGPGSGGISNGFLGTFTNHPLSLISAGITGLRIGITGLVEVVHFSNAGVTQTCFNASFELSICSSSLRYKTNLAPYSRGLDVIDRLRPLTFDWKQGGMHDLGFGAEEVEKIDPLLVTYNDRGQVEGVKYDRISATLVNAVKEQQAQIQQQQTEIEGLKQLVCLDHPNAEVCKTAERKP